MECPLCKGEIADGAKVCKHCKAKIIKCPNCLEYTDGHKEKCQVCDSLLDADTQSAKQTKSPNALQREEAEILIMKNKKSFGVSLFLNFLWAGWGVHYCKAENGRWIVFVNIVAFILSWFTAAVPSLLLFIYASFICYRQVEVYNAQLELETKKRIG
ncbi:MAG: hypothetical protein LWX56_00630 [Ignavibacteria bacterium]|nr:hypothetical protein [Ignavibacteria bacterium]